MSKAFTKEDDSADVIEPRRPAHARLPATPLGVRLARDRVAQLDAALAVTANDGSTANELAQERAKWIALANAEISRPPADASIIALGAEVNVRDTNGAERTVVIASAQEVGLVANAVSVGSPMGRALLGASAGDQVDVDIGGRVRAWSVMDVRYP